jgi:hypothetical protein
MSVVYSDFSEYLRRKLVDHALGTTSFTMPTAIYVSAYQGDPFGSGTEIDDGTHTEYERQTCAFDSADTNGDAASAEDVTWAQAVAAWSTSQSPIDYAGLHDAATGGNLLARVPLSPSKVIDAGDTLSIPSGDLHVSDPASITV